MNDERERREQIKRDQGGDILKQLREMEARRAARDQQLRERLEAALAAKESEQKGAEK